VSKRTWRRRCGRKSPHRVRRRSSGPGHAERLSRASSRTHGTIHEEFCPCGPPHTPNTLVIEDFKGYADDSGGRVSRKRQRRR